MLTLFKHQWKETVRSTIFQKNLVVNIIMGLFALYFLVIFTTLGVFTNKIIAEIYPDSDPIEVFRGFLILGFLYDLVVRFFFQELPTMTIAPYLHLPMKRSKLVNNMLIRSVFSFFNFMPLFLFVPYGLITLAPQIRNCNRYLFHRFDVYDHACQQLFIGFHQKNIGIKYGFGGRICRIVNFIECFGVF